MPHVATAPRPRNEEIVRRIETGNLTVHPSRIPMTRWALNSIMVTVQKQLGLVTGLNGGWTQEADVRLRANMAAPKRGSQGMVKQKAPLLTFKNQKENASSDST